MYLFLTSNDQKKDHPDLERPPKKNRSQQLQTHNVPTSVGENTNGGDYWLFANKPRTIPQRTEMMP